MMRRFVLSIPLLLVVTSVGGCLPATFTDMPAFKGRVVNAAGQPISGAKVSVAPKEPANGGHAVEVATDRQGQFHRNEEVHFGFALLLPLDSIVPQFIATARADGKQSKPLQFGGGIDNPHYLGIANPSRSFDLGDLVVPQ
jgi:hypothetical protein